MSVPDPLFEAVRALVERIAGPSRVPAHGARDARLTEGYWLDSVELLEVLVACEATFGIAFDDTRDVDALDTLGSLTTLVRSKLAVPRSTS